MNRDHNTAQERITPLQSKWQDPIQKRVEILFEFTVSNSKPTIYRAVKAIDGSFRMEKRGQNAKKFKTIMRCGLEEGLHQFRMAIEAYFRNLARSEK